MIRQLGKTLMFTGAIIFLTSAMTIAAEKPATMVKMTDGKEHQRTLGVKVGEQVSCVVNGTCQGSRRANAVANALAALGVARLGSLNAPNKLATPLVIDLDGDFTADYLLGDPD